MFKITKSVKIVSLIIFLILLIIWLQISFKPKVDTNSYVTLIKWTALLNNKSLEFKKKEILKANYIIKTGSGNSLAVIQWWEWSITRIGPNTSIEISKNQVSSDLTKIQILFNIIWNTWKTWSDVISFIWDKSYFKEWFVDTEAAVRWTTFEVNLDKKYLYVEKHEVQLFDLKTNKSYIIPEKKPFNIDSFDFIALQRFILHIRDKVWENLNKNLDKQFFIFLRKNLDLFLSQWKNILLTKHNIDFSKLSQIEKNRLYENLLASYQELKPSSITPKDWNLYNLKLQYQEILTQLAPVWDKKDLLRTSIYDLKDAIDTKNFDIFKNITILLWQNKKYIDFDQLNKTLNFSWLGDSFKNNFNSLLKNFNFNWNIEEINNLFWNSFSSFWNAMSDTLSDIKNKISNITNTILNK